MQITTFGSFIPSAASNALQNFLTPSVVAAIVFPILTRPVATYSAWDPNQEVECWMEKTCESTFWEDLVCHWRKVCTYCHVEEVCSFDLFENTICHLESVCYEREPLW